MQPLGRSERGSAERRTEFHAIFVDERRFREWYDVAAKRVYAYLFGQSLLDPKSVKAADMTFAVDALLAPAG